MADDGKTHISAFASAAVKATLERGQSLRRLSHPGTEGELMELLIAQDLIEPFLTSGFRLGTGVIVNSAGTPSSQTDIVIYDNTILPAFVERQRIGMYPVESVLATVEVAAELKTDKVIKTQKDALKLISGVWRPAADGLMKRGGGPTLGAPVAQLEPPISALVAFGGAMPQSLGDETRGGAWLETNKIRNLFAICVIGQFCWARTKASQHEWSYSVADEQASEAKRFLALLLDNVRTVSERRRHVLFGSLQHHDWFSQYMREDVGPAALAAPSAAPSLEDEDLEGQTGCSTYYEVGSKASSDDDFTTTTEDAEEWAEDENDE